MNAVDWRACVRASTRRTSRRHFVRVTAAAAARNARAKDRRPARESICGLAAREKMRTSGRRQPLRGHDAILDGEVVALDASGRADCLLKMVLDGICTVAAAQLVSQRD